MVASPYARKLAREAGVDISQASASGADNRIIASDVQELIKSGADTPSRLVCILKMGYHVTLGCYETCRIVSKHVVVRNFCPELQGNPTML